MDYADIEGLMAANQIFLLHTCLIGSWTKLMVVGGPSQIYDLSGQNLNCPLINDSFAEYGSVGTFINNKAMVCGGYKYQGQYFSDCYSYDMQVFNDKYKDNTVNKMKFFLIRVKLGILNYP